MTNQWIRITREAGNYSERITFEQFKKMKETNFKGVAEYPLLHPSVRLEGKFEIEPASIGRESILKNSTVLFYSKVGSKTQIVKTLVWEKVSIGDNCNLNSCNINSHSVIGDNCEFTGSKIQMYCNIGANSKIDANTTVGHRAIIGKNVVIGRNVEISDRVIIEDNVIIEDGAKIGGSSIICQGSLIKTGAVIGSDVNVGQNATVGMAAKVGIESIVKAAAIVKDGQVTGVGATITKGAPYNMIRISSNEICAPSVIWNGGDTVIIGCHSHSIKEWVANDYKNLKDTIAISGVTFKPFGKEPRHKELLQKYIAALDIIKL